VHPRSKALHVGVPLWRRYRGFLPDVFWSRPRLASVSRAALSVLSSNFDSAPSALFTCLKVKLTTFPLAFSTRFLTYSTSCFTSFTKLPGAGGYFE
jgi:hypothetical protein